MTSKSMRKSASREDREDAVNVIDEALHRRIESRLLDQSRKTSENLRWLYNNMHPYLFITMKEEEEAIIHLAERLPDVANETDGDTAYDLASLWHGLTGEGDPYASQPDDLVPLADGRGEGTLRGGCLSILAAPAGTPWALRSVDEPTILFVEDVDEKPYRVDRMMRQLRASGALSGVTGVVFGDMKGCTPTFHDDYRLEDVLLETLEGLDVPIALGLSSGHTAHPNLTLPLGVRARLECYGTEARLTVLEAPVE